MTGPMPTKTPDEAHYRLDPDRPFPLIALLQATGLPPAHLAEKCGYANIAKGVRRLEALANGDLSNFESLKISLAEALGIDLDQLVAAATDTRYIQWARQDRAYRREFEPHVIWKTTLTRPSPITIAGMIGASRGLKYLPSNKHPLKISVEAVANCPRGVPCYGQVTGFYVNYSPDQAVEFDREGEALSVLDTAVRPGYATARINGRPLTLGVP